MCTYLDLIIKIEVLGFFRQSNIFLLHIIIKFWLKNKFFVFTYPLGWARRVIVFLVWISKHKNKLRFDWIRVQTLSHILLLFYYVIDLLPYVGRETGWWVSHRVGYTFFFLILVVGLNYYLWLLFIFRALLTIKYVS